MSVGIQQLPAAAYTGGETPNTSVFGQPIDSRVIGGVTWQVCAYWSYSSTPSYFADKRLIIGVRTLPHGTWTWHVQTAVGLQVDDSHNTIAIGIDADGYIHVWYDHHNNVLRYRKSDAPLASWTGTLTGTLSMLGTNETSCTYPQRFYDPLGKMYFMMRMSGMSGDGSYYLMRYDETTTSWSACAGLPSSGLWIDGESTTPDYSPYPNDVPRFTSDWDGAGTGFMHVAWTWRSDLGLLNNNVCHMRWNGSTWTQWDGAAQTMPAAFPNSRVVLTVPESELYFNSPGSCLDANGRPHLAVIKTNGTDHQLYDLYFTGAAWNLQVLTAYTGAAYTDFGRPALQCDPDTNEVFFWGSNTFEADGIIQWKSDPGDFTTWTKSTFYSAAIGVHEPQLDQGVWDRDRLACVFTVLGRDVSAGIETPRIVTRAPKGRTATFDSETWTRKHAITIDADQVGAGGVTGYTVRLSRSHFADEACDPSSANKARKDGGDLRFFSDAALTTPIACDVQRFGHDSTTGAGDAVVNVDVGPLTLSATVDTVIYVAYGAPGYIHQPFVDEAFGALAAKDGGWKHDAPMLTHYGRHDVLDDKVETWSVGKLLNIGANGVAFDGTFPMRMESRVRGISSGFAVAVTVNEPTGSTTPMMIGADDSSTNRGLQFRLDADGKARAIRFNSSNAVLTNMAGATVVRGVGSRRLAAEFHGAGTKIYVGGVVDASDALATANHDDSALVWHIGGRYRASGAIGYGDVMAGTLQRVEIHQPRGDAWWVTDANNLMTPATFAVAGAPASIGGAPVEHALDGAASSTAAASAALTTAVQMAGAAASITTATGTITTAIQMAGASASITTADGNLSTSINLAGGALAQAAAAAQMATGIPLVGAGTGSASATGSLTTDSGGLEGAATALATAIGLLTVEIRLSGAALAQALATADLTAPGSGFEGTAQAQASASGALGTAIPLIGEATATASAAGSLGVPILLSGAAASTSTATGDLTLSIALEGHSLASALASGSISTQIMLDGAAVSRALASGALFGVERITAARRTIIYSGFPRTLRIFV